MMIESMILFNPDKYNCFVDCLFHSVLTLTLAKINTTTKTTVSPLTQDKRCRCITLQEPRLLGDAMGVGRGEAQGETPLKTANQMQRGSASLQSTPTEH